MTELPLHETPEFWTGRKPYTLPESSIRPGATITFGKPLEIDRYAFHEDDVPDAVRVVEWMRDVDDQLSDVKAVAKRPRFRLTPEAPATEQPVPWGQYSIFDHRELVVLEVLLEEVRAGRPCSYVNRPLSVPQWIRASRAPTGPFVLERHGAPMSDYVLRQAQGDDVVQIAALAAVCVAKALEFLSGLSITHRDVTLANIFLGIDGVEPREQDFVVLGDFDHSSGVSDRWPATTRNSLLSQQTLGTSFVQSPDLLRTVSVGREGDAYYRADLGSDLFALGVCLHAAVLRGTLPWEYHGRPLNWGQAPEHLTDVASFANAFVSEEVELVPATRSLEEKLNRSPVGQALLRTIQTLLDEDRLREDVDRASDDPIGGIVAERLRELGELVHVRPPEERPRLPVLATSDVDGTSSDGPLLEPRTYPRVLGGDPLAHAAARARARGAFVPEQPTRAGVVVGASRMGGTRPLRTLPHGFGGIRASARRHPDWLGFCLAVLLGGTSTYAAVSWSEPFAHGRLAPLICAMISLLIFWFVRWFIGSRRRRLSWWTGAWSGSVAFVPVLVAVAVVEITRATLLWWNPDIGDWDVAQVALFAAVSLTLIGATAPLSTRSWLTKPVVAPSVVSEESP